MLIIGLCVKVAFVVLCVGFSICYAGPDYEAHFDTDGDLDGVMVR